MDAQALVVARRIKAQAHIAAARHVLNWHEVDLVDRAAVHPEHIDLALIVLGDVVRIAADSKEHRTLLQARRLALHTMEAMCVLVDEVVAQVSAVDGKQDSLAGLGERFGDSGLATGPDL
ncbi:MAG TPA: hypothetical protein VML96_04505 [Egibacteraceae bacterium]|nr:hypothetical protein [Egibacteraceae bacterium]